MTVELLEFHLRMRNWQQKFSFDSQVKSKLFNSSVNNIPKLQMKGGGVGGWGVRGFAAAFVSAHGQKYQDSLILTLLICLPMVSKALNNWLWDIVCSGVPHNWILCWKHSGWDCWNAEENPALCNTFSLKWTDQRRLIFIPVATGNDGCTFISWLMYKAHTFGILKQLSHVIHFQLLSSLCFSFVCVRWYGFLSWFQEPSLCTWCPFETRRLISCIHYWAETQLLSVVLLWAVRWYAH